MPTTTTLDVQKALKKKGFDPGPLDGVRGRLTIDAIIAFQTASGLKPDGIAGPQTIAKLISGDAKASGLTIAATLPWYAEAQRLLGLKEDTTAGSNEQLLAMGRELGVPYTDDAIPWCGLFVGHCIASQLPREPLPDNPLGARNWQSFGRKVDPQPGAVMVFWRESRKSGLGHVGFYVAENAAGEFMILGGNQGDAVSIIRKPKDRFLEARWPKTALPADGSKVIAEYGRGDEREV